MEIFVPISLFAGILGLIITIVGLVQLFNKDQSIKKTGTKLFIAGLITVVVSILVFFSTFWMSFRR